MQKNYTIAVAGTGYKVRLYKSTLRLQRNRDECTQRVFYRVENMIAGVVGYDSIRKHLAA